LESAWTYAATIDGTKLRQLIFKFSIANFFLKYNIFCVFQCAKIGSSLWLSDWSESADVLPANESRAQHPWRLGVYAALGGGQGI